MTGRNQVDPLEPPSMPGHRPARGTQVFGVAHRQPLPDPLSVMPTPTRPASRHAPQARPVPAARGWKQFAGLTELLMALPWLWWSWLSIQFLGLFNDTLYAVVLTLALLSGVGIFFHQYETFLAKKWWRLREPSELELGRMAPAWLSVCQAAGVDPDSFRIWIHEGPEVTAPATVGRTIALTNWSLYTLPQRNLEAVLAHELAHHLPLPQKVSLFLYWLSLPARMTGVVIDAGLKHRVFKRLIGIVIGILTVGVFVLWYVTEFDYFTVMMLSPWAAPLLLPWLSRKGEEMADRTAADLGYAHPLREVFANREFERARSVWRPQRFSVSDSQPIETTRLRRLDNYLKRVAESTHQPYRIDSA
ncbi:M48 family metalloprotease [Kribbella sp. NPDC023855]|uniref:M48 family metalloprotease n=1 Tax=Kribbella sp. NPDC023855 TaxID=3154698 RepID=UPI003410BF23